MKCSLWINFRLWIIKLKINPNYFKDPDRSQKWVLESIKIARFERKLEYLERALISYPNASIISSKGFKL